MTRQLPLRGPAVFAFLLAAAVIAACAPTYVIVPQPRDGYSARDTLHGRLKGKDIRVTFHFDTTWQVDTVTRWRTIYRPGARVDTVVVIEEGRRDRGRRGYGQRVDTVFVVVHDTVRVFDPRRPYQRVDTVRVVVHDTVRVFDPRRPNPRVDTVRVVVHDTVRITEPRRPDRPDRPIIMPPPPEERHVDTVRVPVRDTTHVPARDTARNREEHPEPREPHRPRTANIPPGQYPPDGLCRLWIVGRPPGLQARPAACTALGTIPAHAFILFAGKAWDADYDWSSEPEVPPEILALSRRRRS